MNIRFAPMFADAGLARVFVNFIRYCETKKRPVNQITYELWTDSFPALEQGNFPLLLESIL